MGKVTIASLKNPNFAYLEVCSDHGYGCCETPPASKEGTSCAGCEVHKVPKWPARNASRYVLNGRIQLLR